MRLKALVILLEDVDNKLKIYRLQLVLPHELLLAILTPESLFDLESAFDPEGPKTQKVLPTQRALQTQMALQVKAPVPAQRALQTQIVQLVNGMSINK